MTAEIPCCEPMRRAIEDPDVPVVWTPKFREIGVSVLDGGDSVILFAFCPWCGSKLPESLRDQWFSELERLGIDPYGTDVPVEFLDEAWFKGR